MMNFVINFSTYLLLFFVSKYGEAVVNGRNAQQGRFPYMASLQHYVNKHQCGAAIIHEKYALTAGHCVYEKKESDHMIQYGSVTLDDTEPRTRAIKTFHLHPDYVPAKYEVKPNDSAENSSDPELDDLKIFCGARFMESPMQNDIAVIEVYEPFADVVPLMSSAKPKEGSSSQKEPPYTVAKIGLADEFLAECATCTIAGWGKLDISRYAPLSNNLKYFIISIHHEGDCEREKCGVYENVFCAQHFGQSASLERGDSGGPLVCSGLIIGVVSFIDLGKGAPAYFVNVSKYRSFIDPFITSETDEIPDELKKNS